MATAERSAPDDDPWVVGAGRLRTSSFVIDGRAVRFGACGLLRLFPPRSKLLDLLEIENRLRKFAFSDDYHRIALFGEQQHRPRHRGTQFHDAVIGQRNKLFGV
jgi:hypothetical protein